MARLRGPYADLRWGIIFIALAAGFVSLGFSIPVDDPTEIDGVHRAFLGIAGFPLFLGLAFLGLHFFANENKRR